MADDETHPVVLVLAGIGLGALVAGALTYLLRPEPGEASPEGVRRAAARLRHRAETLARQVREKTAQWVEMGREELDDAVRAGRQAADAQRRQLERELHNS